MPLAVATAQEQPIVDVFTSQSYLRIHEATFLQAAGPSIINVTTEYRGRCPKRRTLERRLRLDIRHEIGAGHAERCSTDRLLERSMVEAGHDVAATKNTGRVRGHRALHRTLAAGNAGPDVRHVQDAGICKV